MRAEIVGGPAQRGSQIWPAYVADEQGVSGEHGVRVGWVFLEIKDQDGDGLDGVARGFQDLQAQAGKVEGVSIGHGDKGVFRFGSAAQINGGAAAVAQFEMAGDEVGVEVGQKDVADVEA